MLYLKSIVGVPRTGVTLSESWASLVGIAWQPTCNGRLHRDDLQEPVATYMSVRVSGGTRTGAMENRNERNERNTTRTQKGGGRG